MSTQLRGKSRRRWENVQEMRNSRPAVLAWQSAAVVALFRCAIPRERLILQDSMFPKGVPQSDAHAHGRKMKRTFMNPWFEGKVRDGFLTVEKRKLSKSVVFVRFDRLECLTCAFQ